MKFSSIVFRSIEVVETSSVAATLLAGYSEVDSGGIRPLMGVSRFGAAFGYNPFELYNRGIVTSPNGFVFGQIGKGKSALVKSYLARMYLHGYPSVVLDPKGEYQGLANHFGFDVVRFIDSRAGVNPFVRSSHDDTLARELNREMAERAICAMCKRDLTEYEGLAISEALHGIERDLNFQSLRHQLVSLDQDGGPKSWLGASQPGDLAAVVAACDSLLGSGLVARSSDVGNITSAIYLGILVIDLSQVFGTDLYSLAVTLVLGAIRAAQFEHQRRPLVVAIDEIWALTQNEKAARWLQSYWKLSRSLGIANLGVAHRYTDLGSGASEQGRGVAEGLMMDSETLVLFGMGKAAAERLCDEFGLVPELAVLLSRLGPGIALWQIGKLRYLVEHQLTKTELTLCNTDSAMMAKHFV